MQRSRAGIAGRVMRGLCLAFCFLFPREVFASPLIRVALAVHVPQALFSSKTPFLIQREDGKEIPGGEEMDVRADHGEVVLNGEPVNVSSLRFVSESPILFEGRRYAGIFQIRNDEEFLDVVNVLDLEEYVSSVVGSEISSHWPGEALKAQAVVARTYALWKMEKKENPFFDLLASTKDQLYLGLESAASTAGTAAQETRGEALTDQGKAIKAYYCADCGGRTENGKDVFPEEGSYLRSVVCPYGKSSPYQSWTKTYSFSELSELLGKHVTDLSLQDLDDARRVSHLRIKTEEGEETIPALSLRKLLGTRNLRSTQFTILQEKKLVLVPKWEEVPGKMVQVLSPSFVYKPVLIRAALPVLSPALLIYGNGALTEAEFSPKNPLAAVTGDRFLAPVSGPITAVAYQKKFKKREILISEFHRGPARKKVVMVPSEVPVSVTFVGHGWGHGVGMCQWGARGMALLGKSYQEILRYYYRGINFSKMY